MAVVDRAATMLYDAWRTRTPIAPVSENGIRTIEDAYAVQTAWVGRRLAEGDRIIGRKIGLTNEAMRAQMGVDEPDYGCLLASGHFPMSRGVARISVEPFIQPMVEPEIALRIGRPLHGPGVTPTDVLEAADAVAPALEVLDSRIEDWRITIYDTVADNASYAGFIVGAWDSSRLSTDLASLEVVLDRNQEVVARGTGAAALGHPANATAWLANTLQKFGVGLEPGDVVLSGSIDAAVRVHAGDSFALTVEGYPPLRAEFS